MTQIYGFGAERIDPPPGSSRTELVERSRQMLSRALNLRTLVAFTGSGMSAPLGYPNWKEFTARTIRATRKALEAQPELANDHRFRRLVAMADRVDAQNGEPATPRQYLFYLGFCQQLARALPREKRAFYGEFIRETFGPRASSAGLNPYDALLDLPIQRFVTTNYDVELEYRLCARRENLSLQDFGLDGNPPDGKPPRSFTQKPEFYDQLAGFAVAGVPGMENSVFHCHGRFDDVESIVATEDDYQKWYLVAEDASGGAFRQSIELLFGSNPLLFVGFGMEDEDLLRPLRMFSAADRHGKHSRLLFALLPHFGRPGERDEHDLLFERYGVHVIPYDAPATNDGWATVLTEELGRLKRDWRSNAEEWRKKPPIRGVRVDVKPPHVYQHYAPETTEADLAPRRLRTDLAQLMRLVRNKDVRVIVITGSGGSGKSWRALQLLRLREKHARGSGVFFWSSYYTDDWLTGIDRALAYLEENKPDPRQRRIDRFARCLSREHLLIFDGFERLLREVPHTRVGEAQHQGVRRLLQGAVKGNATIVLTSRLMPDVLQQRIDEFKNRTRQGPEDVREFAVRRITTDDLVADGLYADLIAAGKLTRAEVSSICSLCDGHSYALVLAAAYLDQGDESRVGKLQTALANVSPTHRLSEVISLVVKEVDRECRRAAKPLLERLAIFMSPVTERALHICYAAVRETVPDGAPLSETLDRLRDARLVFRVHTRPHDPSAPEAYTVHPTVRAYVYTRLHHAGSEALPNFALAGYTSGNTAVAPGSPETAQAVTELFGKLVDAAEAHGDSEAGRELCRSAFGVLRSRFESNSVTRWTRYDKYIRYGIRMAMLAKRVSPPEQRWSYAERSDAESITSDEGPLYADELAWLYSDVGLAIYSEGNMLDTYAVWELSYEIDRVTDNEDESGQYIVQSRLHMAGVYLELGKLDTASEYLSLCEQANQKYGDDDYTARVRGYRGLLQHLRADTSAADKNYIAAIDGFQGSTRNLRALSIFLRHRAALKIADKDPDLALRLVRESRTAAEEGHFADLIGYARTMHGHVHRSMGAHADAQHEFKAALTIARRYGVRRLECEVLCEMGRLATELGDWETARARATASLMIANELALGLRQAQGLFVLGVATIRAGNPDLGAAYLRHVHRLARQQQYLLRAREAEHELRKIGKPPDVLT